MKVLAALLYATAGSVLSAIAMALAVGRLTPAIAMLSFAIGIGVGVMALWTGRSQPREAWKVDALGGAMIVVFALFALRSFLWVAFESGNSLWVFSPNNLGDFSLHLTYVRLLAKGVHFWPENPIFADAPLTYPVGMDLFNSLLALAGVDVIPGFVIVGLVGSACAIAALWRWGRGFAIAGFLFAGGTLGFLFFQRWEVVDYQSDAAYAGMVVGWKSLPLALFVTQRGLLYAIPAGLLLLASWRARFLEPDREMQRLPAWGEVLLYAAMPVFHLHTFLFLSFLAAWWFIALAAARRHLFIMVAAAFLPATALTWLITGGFHGASMLGWKAGWMQDSPGYAHPVLFWLQNFGVLPLLVGWLVARLIKNHGPNSAALFVFPALTVFAVCCVVKFAPWEWDNTKLMIWCYLVLLPPLWKELLGKQREWVQAVACFLLFTSGAISLVGGIAGNPVDEPAAARAHQGKPLIGYAIGDRAEMTGIDQATRGISIDDRFIAHPNYNHPLLLTGHLMLMGYEGHVASHGIDYRERMELVKSILNGEEFWRENAESLGARWLLWGKQESENYPDSKQPWKMACRLHASGEWGELYDLRQPVAPPER